MTASKFKVGDRVMVYGSAPARRSDDYLCSGIRGHVTAIDSEGGLVVESKGLEYFAHPKQCRRLIKKPLRRVWIPQADINSGDKSRVSWRQMPDWIEFIEVKKRGG